MAGGPDVVAWPTGQATRLPEMGTAPENAYTCEQIIYYYAKFLVKDPNGTVDYLTKNFYGGFGGNAHVAESLTRAASNPRLQANPKAVAKQACSLLR